MYGFISFCLISFFSALPIWAQVAEAPAAIARALPPAPPPFPSSTASAASAPAGMPSDLPPEFSPELLELLFGDLLKNADLAGGMPPASGFIGGPSLGSADDKVGQITFADENPYQVIALLQNLTGKPVLVQQGLPNVKINFSTSSPLAHEEAVAALESVLSMNGIAIMPLGHNFLRAVPAGSAGAQAPAFLHLPARDFPASSQIYSKFFPFEYLSVPEAIPLVQPFMTPNLATIVPFEKQQTILVTDTLVNLQRIEDILAKVDKPSSKREKVFFFSMKNATASNIQKSLNQLFERGLKNRLQGNTFLDADDRTNKLIVITHPSNLPELEGLIQGFDADATSFTYSEAYALRHAEAPKVVEIIKEIIGGQKQSRDAKKAADGVNKKDKDQPKASEGTLEFSDSVTVVGDERSNAIIAYGTKSDLQQVERLVNQMDVLLPQVRIEVIIAEVGLSDGSQRGLDSFGFNYSQIASPVPSSTGTTTFNDFANTSINSTQLAAASTAPFAITSSLINGNFNLDMVFKKAQTNSNIRILSAPTIVTSHNKVATIEVGEERPIITQTITDTASAGAANTAVKNSVEYKDISLLLKVKPLIGPNGVIQMEIDQAINTVVGKVVINGIDQPIVGKRQAISFVSTFDQEVIVLGGLRQNTITDDKAKLFLLGDLPILGDLLFSPRVKKNEIKELIIFIKPYLMVQPDAATKKPQTAQEQVDRIVDLSANRDELITFIGQGRFPDVPLTDFDRPLSTIFPDPEPKKKAPVPTADLTEVIDPEKILPVVPEPTAAVKIETVVEPAAGA